MILTNEETDNIGVQMFEWILKALAYFVVDFSFYFIYVRFLEEEKVGVA